MQLFISYHKFEQTHADIVKNFKADELAFYLNKNFEVNDPHDKTISFHDFVNILGSDEILRREKCSKTEIIVNLS